MHWSLNPWLGAERGHLTDWLIQRWVRATGRRVRADAAPWLQGPTAPAHGVGSSYLERYTRENDVTVVPGGESVGLLPRFGDLGGDGFDPNAVDPRIVEFYEHTDR